MIEYSYYNGGTWEAYNDNEEFFSPQAGINATSLKRSSTFARTGVYSGKLKMLLANGYTAWRFYTNPSTSPAAYFPNVRPEGNTEGVKNYTITAWVRVDPSAPVTDNDSTVIGFGSNSVSPVVYDFVDTTVGAAKAGWQQISMSFKTSSPVGGLNRVPEVLIKVFHLTGGNLFRSGTSPTPVGNIIIGNSIYIDDINVDPAPVACDIVTTVTGITTQNETATDANDGVIVLGYSFSTSFFPVYMSIDGGVNFVQANDISQAVNLGTFAGLAPGIYNTVVKDSNPTGCQLNRTVEILAANDPPPEPPAPSPVAGALVIDMRPLNRYNFINWFATSGELNFNRLECTNHCWNLPNNYVKKDNSRKSPPIIVVGEQFSFYANFDTPYVYTFDYLKIGICNRYGIVQNDIGVLQKHYVGETVSYNIFASITPSALEAGRYRLVIYDSSTNDILLTSNELEVMLLEDAECVSALFQYKAANDIYKFYYTNVDVAAYINQIRLRCSVIDEQAEGELVQYRAVSSGELRNVSLELDNMLKFEFEHMSELAHEGAKIIPVHEILIINGKQYLCKGLYKKETNKENNANMGTLEVYEQDFSIANRFGVSDVTIVGSDDPLLEGDDESFIKL